MVKLLVAVMVVGSVGVAHAGEAPQAVDAEGLPVHPPGATQPLPPGATQPLPEPDAHQDDTPTLSGGRVIGEAALGGLFGFGGIIVGGYTGAIIETANGCSGELCGLGGFLLGGLVGLTVAAPVGVYLVGTSGDQTGSFAAALGGSAIGTLVGIGAVAATDGSDASALILLGAPLAGAMIGFNATRAYDRPQPARTWMPVASSAHGTTSFGVVGSF